MIPAIKRSSVLLPDPFAPTIATSVPFTIVQSMSSSARTPANDFVTPSSRTAGAPSIGVDDGSNMLATYRCCYAIRIVSIDDLELLDQSRVEKEIGEDFVERQALEGTTL